MLLIVSQEVNSWRKERERAPDTNIKGQKYLETEDRETKDGEIFAERVLEPFPAGF